jgi:ABC-type transport system substrate-binding protein
MRRTQKYILNTTLILALVIISNITFVKAETPFIVAASSAPPEFDPHNSYDSVSFDHIRQFLEGLYAYDYDVGMVIVPQLASAMGTWNAEKTNLTVNLREDVLFHDGSTLNATDVKWNFDRFLYFLTEHDIPPKASEIFFFNGSVILNRTEIVSEYTVKFVLNFKFGFWENLLAFPACYVMKPNEYFEERYISVYYRPVGTGPFVLDDYVPDIQVDYSGFEDYYLGAPSIKTMIFKIIKDPDALSQAVLNHEVHYGGVGSEYYNMTDADDDITVIEVKETVAFYLQFNVLYMPLSVRIAMCHAFDYDYYIQEVQAGVGFVLKTAIPDGMLYHDDTIGFPFNPARAREYMLNSTDTEVIDALDAAGITGASTVTDWRLAAEGSTPVFTYNYTRYRSATVEKVGTMLIDNFKEIGIKVIMLDAIEWGDWLDIMDDPALHQTLRLSFGGWGPDYTDPITMIEPLYRSGSIYNCYQMENSTLDDLFTNSYLYSGIDRENAFKEMQRMLAYDLVPTMYFYQRMARVTFLNTMVSNTDDLLNVFGDLYFYNVVFTPPADVVIPGYNLFLTLSVALGVVVLIVLRKKRR